MVGVVNGLVTDEAGAFNVEQLSSIARRTVVIIIDCEENGCDELRGKRLRQSFDTELRTLKCSLDEAGDSSAVGSKASALLPGNVEQLSSIARRTGVIVMNC